MRAESAFGAPIIRFVETASTMDEARKLAASGTPPGTLVLADHQSQGRGRTRGRSWLGEKGESLLATLVAPEDWKSLPALTLRIGLALAAACEDFARARGVRLAIELKWPNDLMARERKLGGILCESGPEGLLAGFGINIAQDSFPGPLADTATSLALLAAPKLLMEESARISALDDFAAADREEAGKEGAIALRDSLARLCLARLAAIGAEGDWKGEIEARLWRRGRLARISTGLPDGGPSIEARILGLADDGALLAEGLEGSALSFHSAELGIAASVDPGRSDQLS